MSGIDAIGAQVCKLSSIDIDPGLRVYFRLRGFANVNFAQLEDPFGYDKADIKVDAIVEDLRVCILPSTISCVNRQSTAKGSYANTDAFLTGRDERPDRRVEKGLGHVYWVGDTSGPVAPLAPQARWQHQSLHLNEWPALTEPQSTFRSWIQVSRLFGSEGRH